MRRHAVVQLCVPLLLLVFSAACRDTPASQSPPGKVEPGTAVEPSTDSGAAETPADVWWRQLSALCGNAYAGAVTSDDAVDAELAAEAMVFHVRRCEAQRLEVPFHVGENRSRTWILTRTADGIQLQHDHRHEDGSPDVVTLYGGQTQDPGTTTAQHFPADAYSKKLFTDNGLDVSVDNVWSMEIVPDERFSYILRRPGRHFQVDFDLEQTVTPPPAPWGHAPTDGS